MITPPTTTRPPASAQGPASPGAPPLAPVRGFMARLGPTGRGFLLLLMLLLLAVLSLAPIFPRSVTPASAPPDRFSAERAMAHLPIIAREPHPVGSPAQARVRDYLVQQLSAIGVQTEVQRTRGVENVVARLRGTEPTGAIVLLAHYDRWRPGPARPTTAAAWPRYSRSCVHSRLAHRRATT